jgi:hypothetical protein
VSAEAIRLCCLLWAAEGEVDGLHAYEDAVLALVPAHGGAVVLREFGDGAEGTPHEVQIFAFRERAGLESYLADPARTERAAERDRVVARTELFPVRLPGSDGARP